MYISAGIFTRCNVVCSVPISNWISSILPLLIYSILIDSYIDSYKIPIVMWTFCHCDPIWSSQVIMVKPSHNGKLLPSHNGQAKSQWLYFWQMYNTQSVKSLIMLQMHFCTDFVVHLPPCVQYITIPIIGIKGKAGISEIKKSDFNHRGRGRTKQGDDWNLYTNYNEQISSHQNCWQSSSTRNTHLQRAVSYASFSSISKYYRPHGSCPKCYDLRRELSTPGWLRSRGFTLLFLLLLQLSRCEYNVHETAQKSSESFVVESYKLEVLSQNGGGVGAMAPTASLFYSWDEDEDDGTPRPVTLDCLLPTGVIVPLRVDKDNTLAEIKEVLFYQTHFEGHF